MATAGAPVAISAPLPQAPAYSLLATVPVTEDGGDVVRWLNGASVWGYPPGCGAAWDPCSAGSPPKDDGGAPALPEFAAFTAYLPETCSALSIGDPATFARRALAAFAARESNIVERFLAVADEIPDNPHLTDGNASLLNAGNEVSAMEGLALLEDAIGTTCQAGVIHATPGIATAWNCCYLLYRDGQTLRTVARNTPVVVGDGYIGVRPDNGAAPEDDQAWAFATNGVAVYRTDAKLIPAAEQIAAALERETNVVTYRAERDYLAVYESPSALWDGGLQAAVLIDRSL